MTEFIIIVLNTDYRTAVCVCVTCSLFFCIQLEHTIKSTPMKKNSLSPLHLQLFSKPELEWRLQTQWFFDCPPALEQKGALNDDRKKCMAFSFFLFFVSLHRYTIWGMTLDVDNISCCWKSSKSKTKYGVTRVFFSLCILYPSIYKNNCTFLLDSFTVREFLFKRSDKVCIYSSTHQSTLPVLPLRHSSMR